MKSLTLRIILEFPLQETSMRRLYLHSTTFLGAFVALVPPPSQGADLVILASEGFNHFSFRANTAFEQPKLAALNRPHPNQKRIDRHAFRKHQVPRKRVARKR